MNASALSEQETSYTCELAVRMGARVSWSVRLRQYLLQPTLVAWDEVREYTCFVGPTDIEGDIVWRAIACGGTTLPPSLPSAIMSVVTEMYVSPGGSYV